MGNLERSRDLLERIQATAEAIEVQGLVAEAYEASGDTEGALREQKRFKDATDAFQAGRIESRLAEAQGEFESECPVYNGEQDTFVRSGEWAGSTSRRLSKRIRRSVLRSCTTRRLR